jgi:uncharacterized coiled-coil protein SlyX
MASNTSGGAEISERLTRLEEAETFAQRTVDELNAEVVELNRRLADALARLERLEARLDSASPGDRETALEGDRPPPPPEIRD